MREVFIHGHNIVSSLGITTKENFDSLKQNLSGIKNHNTGKIYGDLPLSLIDKNRFKANVQNQIKDFEAYSFFEQIMLWSAKDALSDSNIDTASERTLFIISTTKGNIEKLKTKEGRESDKVKLWHSARKIAKYFGNTNEPMVVSNACVSGVMAVNIATQLLQDALYDHVVVIGGDVVSDFVIAGFMSFHALSSNACKPFDGKRDGLTLGEASGCIVLSSELISKFSVIGGANTNDANHISGPSRTAEGLFLAIQNTLNEAQLTANDIDFISAHGTATVYNDMMESIALKRHSLDNTPTNSFKGYWGHTLGASGIIEIVATLQSMEEGLLIKSYGYETPGETETINIVKRNTPKELKSVLKTAAGFGGANSSIIIKQA